MPNRTKKVKKVKKQSSKQIQISPLVNIKPSGHGFTANYNAMKRFHSISAPSRDPADCSMVNGCTVRGCTVSNFFVNSSGALSSNYGIISSTSGGTPVAVASLSLFYLTHYVHGIADLHIWYRVRKLRAHLIPALPTSYSGVMALAIMDNANLSPILANPTGNHWTLDQEICGSGNVSQGVSTPWYIYNGPKVWSTKGTLVDASERQQLLLMGTVNGLKDPTGAYPAYCNLGEMMLEYEVDFYGIGNMEGNVNASVNAPRFADVINRLTSDQARQLGRLPDELKALDSKFFDPPASTSVPSSGSSSSSSGPDEFRSSDWNIVTKLSR